MLNATAFKTCSIAQFCASITYEERYQNVSETTIHQHHLAFGACLDIREFTATISISTLYNFSVILSHSQLVGLGKIVIDSPQLHSTVVGMLHDSTQMSVSQVNPSVPPLLMMKSWTQPAILWNFHCQNWQTNLWEPPPCLLLHDTVLCDVWGHKQTAAPWVQREGLGIVVPTNRLKSCFILKDLCKNNHSIWCTVRIFLLKIKYRHTLWYTSVCSAVQQKKRFIRYHSASFRLQNHAIPVESLSK